MGVEKIFLALGMVVLIAFTSIALSGCTKATPLDVCRMSNDGFEVYVGNTIYHNCSLYGNGCASSSGCTFRDCTELGLGDYVHSNEYVKRCP